MSITDIISASGVTFILAAFFLSTFKFIASDSRIYFLLNFVGGALACWGSMLIPSLPFTVLEGVWAIVAVIGLAKTFAPKSES
ncbi:MAG: CBU_0592 family membrane protein [Bacteroidia bacterium]